MDLGSHNNSYLAPGSHLQSRRASVSTAFTDTMSNNMRRELSQSSHVTDSSRTASDIHSNIGDSIVAFPPLIPQYIQGDTETFHWSRPQIEVGDQSTFNATDHRLLPPETPLPQPTPGINDPLSNIEASINDPNALFELVIDRLRQEYATHPNQTTYALSLAQTHLGTNAIRRLITPRVQLLRTPQVSSTPSIIGRRASNTTQQRYLCKLCPTPVGITTKGAFRRHVNDKHQAKSLFLCMRCEWSSTRKDKLRNHLRVRHPNDSGQDLTERELVMPEPSHCVLCETDRLMNHSPPFLSWDAWFVGVEAHCRVDENPENEMKRETDTPPDQEDGTRGAGGFLFPTLSFTRGSSAGSTSFSQGSNLAPDSTFSGWTFNGPPTHGLGDNKNKDRKQHVIRHLSDGECLKLTDISENMSALSLYDRPSKPRASSSSDVAADRNSSKILSISDLIQQLDIATLVFSINKISLVLTEKLQVIKFEDSTKISFDPLIFGEKTLYRIHCDHPVFHRALSRHLSRCSTSLNAIQRELSSVSTIPTPATKSKEQCHRRKRLSSLWARLRAVSFVLSLQKEVAIDEGYAPHPRNAKDKLISNKAGLSKATMSPFTSEALKYLYKLAQKHLPLDSGGGIFDDDKTNSLKSYSRSPNVDSSLGVFGFLQGLTAVISNPKPSVVESYDTTDLYGLLHRSMTNLSTTSF